MSEGIANLNLAPVETLSDEEYEAPPSFTLPNDGTYRWRLPKEFISDSDTFGEDRRGVAQTEKGALQFVASPTIIGDEDGIEIDSGPARNYTSRYQRVSARMYPWRQSSELMDLVRATGGLTSDIPANPQAAIGWIQQELPSQEFTAFARWQRSIKKPNGEYINLKGQSDFEADVLRAKGITLPESATGIQTQFPHPFEKDDQTGQPKVIRANFEIVRYVVD